MLKLPHLLAPRSWTKLWNNVAKRAAVVLVSGLVMMYAGVKYDYLGAAALVPALARATQV